MYTNVYVIYMYTNVYVIYTRYKSQNQIANKYSLMLVA